MSDTRKPHFFETTIRVLGFMEDDAWNAVALEMDLWGRGETFGEAVADLMELVEVQVDFAHFREKTEMIWKDADPKYWGLFYMTEQRLDDVQDLRTGRIGLPESDPAESDRPVFVQANA